MSGCAQQELQLTAPSRPAPLHTCYLGDDAPAWFSGLDCPASCVHAEDHAQTATCGERWCEAGGCHVECWAKVMP